MKPAALLNGLSFVTGEFFLFFFIL